MRREPAHLRPVQGGAPRVRRARVVGRPAPPWALLDDGPARRAGGAHGAGPLPQGSLCEWRCSGSGLETRSARSRSCPRTPRSSRSGWAERLARRARRSRSCCGRSASCPSSGSRFCRRRASSASSAARRSPWAPASSTTSCRCTWPSAGRIKEFQALCTEFKTQLESSHATTLESRFSKRAYEAYVESPRLPPLVCKLQSWNEERFFHGVDVVRCRKNGLANARFPPTLPHARGRRRDVAGLPLEPRRHGPRGALPRLSSGQDGGGLGRGAPRQAGGERAHRALGPQRGPGLLDAHLQQSAGLQRLPVPPDLRRRRGRQHWDHIFVTQLYSNASHRPAWDFVMAAEHCAVARIRQLLADVPMRYFKSVKTDCHLGKKH